MATDNVPLYIPRELWEDFLRFLDVAQCGFTEDDVANFSPNEFAVLQMVERWIKHGVVEHWVNGEELPIAPGLNNGTSRRYRTITEKRQAASEFASIIT